MSRGRTRYSRNYGLKLIDRIFCLFKDDRLTRLLFNYGLMLCGLSLFPYFLKVTTSWNSRCPFLLTIIIITDFLEKSIPFSKIFLKRFFRRASSKFVKTFLFLGRWWESNPLSPKANVSKGATLLYLNLLIGGSPFYLTAIYTIIVSYFKESVKREFQISLKIC